MNSSYGIGVYKRLFNFFLEIYMLQIMPRHRTTTDTSKTVQISPGKVAEKSVLG